MQKFIVYIKRLYCERAELFWYYLTWVIYGLLLVFTALFAFIRLDFIRTTPKLTSETEEK